MVNGLPLIEKQKILYYGCVLGKQHNKSFPVGMLIRPKTHLEIMHSYLCGPMHKHSISESH